MFTTREIATVNAVLTTAVCDEFATKLSRFVADTEWVEGRLCQLGWRHIAGAFDSMMTQPIAAEWTYAEEDGKKVSRRLMIERHSDGWFTVDIHDTCGGRTMRVRSPKAAGVIYWMSHVILALEKEIDPTPETWMGPFLSRMAVRDGAK